MISLDQIYPLMRQLENYWDMLDLMKGKELSDYSSVVIEGTKICVYMLTLLLKKHGNKVKKGAVLLEKGTRISVFL